MSCECSDHEMSEHHLLERASMGDSHIVMSASKPRIPDGLQHWKEFVCGGGSAFCNIIISYPLNKLIFRQMMHGVHTTFALNQLQKEGLTYLYRGMLPPLLQRTLSMSVMFGVYDESLRPLLNQGVQPYLAKTMAGIIAGCCEATFMPFERVQTLLIHPEYHYKFKNTAHASIYIAKHYGIKEFYRGLLPILFRNGPSNSLFFIMREEVKERMPKQDKALYQGIQNFVAGASIGAFLSTLFYPLNVIKINMQCRLGGPHQSIIVEFKDILKKRDFKLLNFYHGALLNISRAFLVGVSSMLLMKCLGSFCITSQVFTCYSIN